MLLDCTLSYVFYMPLCTNTIQVNKNGSEKRERSEKNREAKKGKPRKTQKRDHQKSCLKLLALVFRNRISM